MNEDLISIEAQIIDMLSHYWMWSETELFKRKDEIDQVFSRLICLIVLYIINNIYIYDYVL